MAVSEPSAPRTVIRLRVLGVVVAALFSLMFIRLWYLQVLDTSAYSKSVTANQVRDVEVPAPRGLITDRNDSIMVGDQVTQDITLSRVSAQEHPAVVGQLAALFGGSRRPRSKGTSPTCSTACTSPSPSSRTPRSPTSSTSTNTRRCSPACRRSPTPTAPIRWARPACRCSGTSARSRARSSRPTSPRVTSSGTSSARAGSRTQYQADLRGRPGIDKVEVDAHGQVVGSVGETPPTAGDDVVTNIDAGLRADTAAGTGLRDRVAQGQVDRRRRRGARSRDGGGPRPRLHPDL